ncbi:hypothetical protein PILCRDRAFT_814521 [Piloderma croceum F 1598]|uniref:Small ribosomal subunit protein uS10m n=1 Tax=Piloderma croceum (strain F 1598) TaxID=765440 RepID=A0A0C3GAZ4_PILCF|nr:hypothetical protein PILCRDRAFT_814521 [Piloderma croceum F 1598]
MLARHSRLAIPQISRWVRMNSGSNNKPGAGISNADRTASDRVPETSQSTPQMDPQSTSSESYASLLNKTRLLVQPQSQLPNVHAVNEMPESDPALNGTISEQVSSANPAEVVDSKFSAEIPEFTVPELSDLTLTDGAKIEPENKPQQAIIPEQISSVDPSELSHMPDIQFSGATTESSEAEASNLISLQKQPPFMAQKSHRSAGLSESKDEQFETDLSPAQLAHLNELAEACETDEELEELLSSPDLNHLLSLQQLQDLADTPEPIISALPIPGKSLYPPVYHEPQWRIPVATITFRGYDTQRLELFTHFAVHVASALGIPTSKVYPLPKQRRLWTVPRSPFVHKKAQENFERITRSRGVKAWDAHPDVVNLWTQMLMSHAMAGVGMRIVRWTRMELGGGASELKKVKEKLRDLYKQTNEKVADSERVRRVGKKIMETELAAVEQVGSAGAAKTIDAP